jgi:hypothetical protein
MNTSSPIIPQTAGGGVRLRDRTVTLWHSCPHSNGLLPVHGNLFNHRPFTSNMHTSLAGAEAAVRGELG